MLINKTKCNKVQNKSMNDDILSKIFGYSSFCCSEETKKPDYNKLQMNGVVEKNSFMKRL